MKGGRDQMIKMKRIVLTSTQSAQETPAKYCICR